MTIFETILITISLLTMIISYKKLKNMKISFFSFFMLEVIFISIIIFIFNPTFLNNIGKLFGLQTGSLLLIYLSIIGLFYLSIFIFHRTDINSFNLTRLVRELALEKGPKRKISGKELFIIPAYNEEKVIKKTIDNLLENGYENILVINDGSKDNTKKILDDYNNLFNSKILILNHLINRGQGAALETGFERARKYADVDYVITYDADGQHNIEDLKEFYKIMDNNPEIDIALGSRFLKEESKEKIPFLRKIVLILGIIFTYIISGIKYTDVHNGYRVIRKKALDKIKISIDGMGHASEIQDIIAIKKMNYIEVPVTINYTDYSIAKGQKSSNAIKIATRMIFEKIFK